MSYGDVRVGQTVYVIVTDHPSYPKRVYEGQRPYAVFDTLVVADDICEKWNGYYAGEPQPWPFYVMETVVLPVAGNTLTDDGPVQSSLFDGATSGTESDQ